MKYLILCCLLLAGCDGMFPSLEYGPTKEEYGSIQSLNYIPSASGVAPGISTSGKLTMTFWSTPSHHIVILNSPSFRNTTIENSTLFNLVKIGESVIVKYRTVTKVYNKDKSEQRSISAGLELQSICIRNDCISINNIFGDSE